ncbi:MAG: hypothetical protein ACKOA8_12765 [Deltaproteobacteria bacterium]
MSSILIKHRVNAVKDLNSVEKSWGVEIDLRSKVGQKGAIHLSHDPWVEGDDFEVWLTEFRRLQIQGPIWLNTKEDGLEDRIEELLKKYQMGNYCFLDTVLPTLVKKTHFEEKRRFAIRFSAYEPKEFVECFKDKADWIWVDCFQGKPVAAELVQSLKPHFKVCLVSPELHGHGLKENLSAFLPLYRWADAVCTKEPQVWRDAL